MPEDHDREVIVTNRGGSGMGIIVGVIALLAIVAVLWFALGPGLGKSGSSVHVNINVPVPSINLPIPSK